MNQTQFQALKPGDVVRLGEFQYYEVGTAPKWETRPGVYFSTLTASIIANCGVVPFDSLKIAELKLATSKKDLRYITAVRSRREKLMPRMRHDCLVLPDGTVHVQNSVGGLLGQHHVHTAENFAQWRTNVEDRDIVVRQATECCGLQPAQKEMTLADHAEAWWTEQGNTVPPADTPEYETMYKAWHASAFAPGWEKQS